MTNQSVSSIVSALTSDSGDPPPRAGSATHCSSAKYLQTCPTGNGATLLMATLLNTSGSNVTQVRLSYAFTVVSITAEEVPGHRVFYSLTGAPTNWQAIAALSGVASITNYQETVTLSSTWTNNGKLYVVWADDNANGFLDGYLQIDNFAASLPELPGGNTPPVISIESPAGGARIGTNATIYAAAADDGAVTQVVFYADGSLLGSDATWPFSWTWNGAAWGRHELVAVAWDDLSLCTTSTAVNVSVVPASTRSGKAEHVVVISVDGMGSEYVKPLLTPDLVNELKTFKVFQSEGVGTLNARDDAHYAVTLPNHVTMMTGRTWLDAE